MISTIELLLIKQEGAVEAYAWLRAALRIAVCPFFALLWMGLSSMAPLCYIDRLNPKREAVIEQSKLNDCNQPEAGFHTAQLTAITDLAKTLPGFKETYKGRYL